MSVKTNGPFVLLVYNQRLCTHRIQAGRVFFCEVLEDKLVEDDRCDISNCPLVEKVTNEFIAQQVAERVLKE